MSRFSLALVVILMVMLPHPVQAQDNLHLNSVSVDIWPEYDQPSVLVIYHIILSADTSLPADLLLRVPAKANINAVAVVDPVSGLLNAMWNRTVEGEWATLAVSATSLEVQVEYYDSLIKNAGERQIVYEWPGDFAVDSLDVNFLQPVGAENVVIVPAPASTAPGQDGLTNFLIQAGSLAVGQPFTLNIRYQRQTDDLSIASLPVQAASTPGADTPGHLTISGILPGLLAGFGLLLIVGGVVGFLVWQMGSRSASQRKRHGSRKESKTVPLEAIYCHQCGQRAKPKDVFCRTCGTRLRKE